MRNLTFFTEQVAPHQSFINSFDSMVQSNYSGDCSIGVFTSTDTKRQVKALVVDGATDQDKWRVVNLKTENGFDSIAVLGATDNQEAVSLATMHYYRGFDSMNGVAEVAETSANGLNRYLNTPATASHIVQWRLAEQQNVLTTHVHDWDSMAQGTGHYQNVASLLHEIVVNDDNGNLLDSYDSLAQVLQGQDLQEDEFDSIYMDYRHLEPFMNQLVKKMDTYKDKLSVTRFEQSKPFKKNNVTQIAQSFFLSDGQSLTIFYHNPDVTPAKLKNDDNVISWKFLLNKHDITGVIQPNWGEGMSIEQVAQRMMKLANQNSARFKRTADKKAQVAKDLEEAKNAVTAKQTQSDELDKQIAELQSQIDAKMQGDQDNQDNQDNQDDEPNYQALGNYLVRNYFEEKKNSLSESEKELLNLKLLTIRQMLGTYIIQFGAYQIHQTELKYINLSNGTDVIGLDLSKSTTVADLHTTFDPTFVAEIARLKAEKAISDQKKADDNKHGNQLVIQFAQEMRNSLTSEELEYLDFKLLQLDIAHLHYGCWEIFPSEKKITAICYAGDVNQKLEIELSESTTVKDLHDAFDETFNMSLVKYRAEKKAVDLNMNNEPASPFSDEDTQYLKDIISGKADAVDPDMDKIIYLAGIDENNDLLIQAMAVISEAIDKASA